MFIFGEPPEPRGDEEQERRPHVVRRIERELETYFIQIMTVDGTTACRYVYVEVAVVERKESCALQDPEIHQSMLQEYPEHNLRAGMKREMDLMKDFKVAGEISISSLTTDALQSALDTTWVNR